MEITHSHFLCVNFEKIVLHLEKRISGNRTSNKWTQNVNLSGKLAGSQGIKMQNNFRISDENEKMMSEVSFLKAQTFMQDPLSENADADQLSGSFRGSDSFNSDEEDSEEERLCNEKVSVTFQD